MSKRGRYGRAALWAGTAAFAAAVITTPLADSGNGDTGPANAVATVAVLLAPIVAWVVALRRPDARPGRRIWNGLQTYHAWREKTHLGQWMKRHPFLGSISAGAIFGVLTFLLMPLAVGAAEWNMQGLVTSMAMGLFGLAPFLMLRQRIEK